MKRYIHCFFLVFLVGLFSACDSETRTTTQEEASRQEQTTPPREETREVPVDDPDVEQHEIVVQNLQFSPDTLRVKRDQRIQIILTNKGEVDCSITFDLPGGNQELRDPVPPGRRAAIIFTTPKKAGNYPFYSPLRNQRDRGLRGQLIVE